MSTSAERRARPRGRRASAASPESRATIRVHAERDAGGEAAEFLAAGLVAHVGFADEGQPFVLPMTYHAPADEPGRLYLHGAHHSRLMAHLASGAAVCVTVTLVDGLVYSRTALYHSVNYRSVVVFGRAAARQPEPETQRRVFEAMIGRYFPGRTAGVDYEPIPDAHLEATALIALDVEEWSAKARRGGPKGPTDDDPAARGSAGVVAV
jgi:nitroimidazol reductase NimA-like FMN-containing flavoprotein (pyridoxamine 5'-phosphate oxidase superfamily)